MVKTKPKYRRAIVFVELSHELKKRVAQEAKSEERTLSAHVREILKERYKEPVVA